MAEKYAAADELYGKGSYTEAIAALGEDVSADALHRKARWTAELGDETEDSTKKVELYREAVDLALKSIAADDKNYATHKNAAIAKGKLLDHTGMNEKVQLTKDVKDHIETALKIEQTDSASWHVLGMWHKGVAALNWPTRMALSVIFGGMPEASNEKAIECLQQANECYANATSVVERAKVLYDMGRKKEAKEALEAALTMDRCGVGSDMRVSFLLTHSDLPVYRKAQDEARDWLQNKWW